MKLLGRFDILGITFTACDKDYIIKKVVEKAKKGERFLVAPIASHPLVLSCFDSRLKKTLNGLNLVVPDSVYVAWSLRFLYNARQKERVYGPELFLAVCQRAQNQGLKIYLYGNKIAKLKQKLKKSLPKLDLAGEDSGGRDIKGREKEEAEKIKEKMRRSKSKILFIGLGSPTQQNILSYLTDVNFPSVAVGAAFDFISGEKPQASKWMQKLGLEWLFRLLKEPARLWQRYLIYAPLFVFLVLGQKLITFFDNRYEKVKR